MVEVDYRNSVTLVRLNRGITNALNLECVRKLRDSLQQVKTDSRAPGIVLCGATEKFFSIGFDIPQLCDLSEADLQLFYDAFNQVCLNLFTFPKPTVAAITGHAIAGGCILALCCDYRLIAAGRKLMGLNEVKLGVPDPYLVDCVLRNLVGTGNAREIVDLGDNSSQRSHCDWGRSMKWLIWRAW